MKAREVHGWLQSLDGGWVDRGKTVDGFKAGDPEREVAGIAVGWMSFTWALEEAARLGCNLFITHEPTFYHHLDAPEARAWPESLRKLARIEELGLTVLRCHDLWDQMPKIGIPDAWAAKLGLGEPIEGSGYHRVYDGRGRKAIEIGRELAGRVKDYGEPGVRLYGAADRAVRRIVIGTGAITPYRKMLIEYGADLVICTDDGFSGWRDGALAIDNGHAVLVFNHQVSEECGMEQLARLVADRFPELPVKHVRQRCLYTLVS